MSPKYPTLIQMGYDQILFKRVLWLDSKAWLDVVILAGYIGSIWGLVWFW